MKFVDEDGIELPALPDDPTRLYDRDPTPQEIRQRAWEVRLRWSEKERASRQTRRPPWSTPEVPTSRIAREP